MAPLVVVSALSILIVTFGLGFLLGGYLGARHERFRAERLALKVMLRTGSTSARLIFSSIARGLTEPLTEHDLPTPK